MLFYTFGFSLDMDIISDKTLETKILNILSQIRPFLMEDGGDVELVEITSDMVVRLIFKGACSTCAMSRMTFSSGIENAILQAVPEIKKVELV